MKKMGRKKGFTLMEMLIVISIIGILSSFVLGAMRVAQQKGRNANRFITAEQIYNALNLYYEDHGEFICEDFIDSVDAPEGSAHPFLQFLVDGGYLPKSPADPTNIRSDSDYQTLFYEYWTYIDLDGHCRHAAFGYFLESSAPLCIGGHGQQSTPWTNHCHIIVPGPLPAATCNDPWAEGDSEDPASGCRPYLSWYVYH